MKTSHIEKCKIVIIGGGQAGLSMGYYLAQSGQPFVILDASARVGDSWRKRWDSLRLFTPARYNTLPGLPFPAPRHSFPTKDAMADYLEQYAAHFKLPVRSGVKVDALWREGNLYQIKAGNLEFEAEQVVVAMSNYQYPKAPSFAKDLDPGIVQIHSHDYKNLSQLQDGPVLVAGAGNSGAEIALEAAKSHTVWLSGRDTGHIPFDIESNIGKKFLVTLVIRFLFYRILTTSNFLGRKAKKKIINIGGPLIRHKPKDFVRAGITRTGRLTGIKHGKPVVENKQLPGIKNVIWCTGYYPRFSWIDLPIFRKNDQPMQNRGVVENEPGLYFLGLHFLYALSSAMVHGAPRDARYIAKVIRKRLEKNDHSFNSEAIVKEQVTRETFVKSDKKILADG
ncbi:MAG TPA: NAD(P)/FAD-dependent oxidoreductase [Agriterribacter sp.]|nr:NAD(P)/FAD-dependent oxidoreductase [Agriterribacter sp.]